MTTMLQGTTPKINFDFTNSGLSVSDIDAAELTIDSAGKTVTHVLSDMTVNTSDNTLSYQFTEAETLLLNDKYDAFYQLFIKIDSEVYGTKKKPCNIFQKLKGSVMS